jgi:DNA-binding MarR family transcriptional regulator
MSATNKSRGREHSLGAVPASDDVRELMVAMRRAFGAFAAQKLAAADTRIGSCTAGDVAPRHIRVLVTLALDGPQTVGSLAKGMQLSLGAASLMVSELDESGLVDRTPDPADRRRTLVSLAPACASQVESLIAGRVAGLQAVLDQLTPAERQGLIRGLSLLADATHAAPDSATSPPEGGVPHIA